VFDRELGSLFDVRTFALLSKSNGFKFPLYGELTSPTCEWDTATGQAVLEGAGGCVFDAAGFPLRYGKANVLNSHFIAASAPTLGE